MRIKDLLSKDSKMRILIQEAIDKVKKHNLKMLKSKPLSIEEKMLTRKNV